MNHSILVITAKAVFVGSWVCNLALTECRFYGYSAQLGGRKLLVSIYLLTAKT